MYRLEQVRVALRDPGDDVTARQAVQHVYVDIDEKLWYGVDRAR